MTIQQQTSYVAMLNANALLTLCNEYNLTFGQNAHLWRATKWLRGDIPGVADGLTILCTNSVLAWFLTPSGALFYGHIAQFTGKVRPLYSVQAAQAPKERKPRRASTLQAALALLETL